MRKVYAIGETVLDIIFKENKLLDAKAGGAMLNSSVSLGRAGVDISFISEFANDQVGMLVNSFLEENHVNTRNIYRHQDGKTSIAMAFLNEKNDAGYVFYKTHPERRLQIEIPDFKADDILLFGSFYGIDPEIRTTLFNIVEKAKQSGTIVVYDPNFRKPHAHELDRLLPIIKENMSMADIIRGSDEDFRIIFKAESIDQVRDILGAKIPAIIMTKSSSGVYLSTRDKTFNFPVKKITPLSTIGAGDNFNAGVIYGLSRENVKQKEISTLSENQWEKIISSGVGFASDVCMSYENYISESFAAKLK